MITYDILFSDGRVSYGVASNIAAAARRAMRIAQREGIRVVSVSDRYAPRLAVQTGRDKEIIDAIVEAAEEAA